MRLLKVLDLNPNIADKIIDWIDRNTIPTNPELFDSENSSKNAPLDSIDEILLIPGIERTQYDTLLPYITVYGDGRVNINTAETPVLMSLSDSISRDMAERIVTYRKIEPFKEWADIYQVSGFTLEIVGPFQTYMKTRGTAFRVISTAASGGVKKVIDCVLEISGGSNIVRYWREI